MYGYIHILILWIYIYIIICIYVNIIVYTMWVDKEKERERERKNDGQKPTKQTSVLKKTLNPYQQFTMLILSTTYEYLRSHPYAGLDCVSKEIDGESWTKLKAHMKHMFSSEAVHIMKPHQHPATNHLRWRLQLRERLSHNIEMLPESGSEFGWFHP